jgi:hypothetical protein
MGTVHFPGDRLRRFPLMILALGLLACDRPVDSVAVLPKWCPPLPVGDIAPLQALAHASDGWPGLLYTSDNRPSRFQWSSTTPEIATVSRTGELRALTPGTATVSATAEGKTGTRSVDIIGPIRGLEVSPTVASIAVGDTLRVTATVRDASGAPIPGLFVGQGIESTRVAIGAGTLEFLGQEVGTTTITICSANREATIALTVRPRS